MRTRTLAAAVPMPFQSLQTTEWQEEESALEGSGKTVRWSKDILLIRARRWVSGTILAMEGHGRVSRGPRGWKKHRPAWCSRSHAARRARVRIECVRCGNLAQLRNSPLSWSLFHASAESFEYAPLASAATAGGAGSCFRHPLE